MVVRRPVGVAILAILSWFAAGLLLIFGILIGAAIAEFDDGTALGVGVGAFYVILGSIGLTIGVGLWYLKAWAWWLQMVATGLGLVSSLTIIAGGDGSAGSAILFAISAVVLAYLLSGPIRAAFGVGGGAPAGTVMR